MTSIAGIVQEIVVQQPFIADAMARGLINYAALTKELIPQVRELSGREVRKSAVMMALRRLAEKLKCNEVQTPRFGENCEVMIRSNLFNLTVVSTPSAFEIIHNFRERIAHDRGEIFTVTHGLHELTAISNRIHLEPLRSALHDETITAVFPQISMLVIRIANEEYSKTPGYLYTLTKALAWKNINIIEIISTHTEVGFTIADEDVPRTYEAMMNVISE